MNRGRFSRRFNITRFQDKAGQMEERVKDQATALAEQAREGVIRSRDAIVTFERAVVRNFQENPTLFVAIGVALLGIFISKLVIERREEHF